MIKRYLIIGAGAGLAVAGLWYWFNQPELDPRDEDLMDTAMTTFDELIGGDGVLAEMSTSGRMVDQLQRRERFVATPYQLGDGGWTVGYGHFEKNYDDLPDCSTREKALAVFANDLVERAEKWVKLYVSVALTQNEFDALVSIAFNLSPRSFKKFAQAVNEGQGIDAIAADSVAWVSPKFTNGIRNRRNDELNVFNNGVYA